MSVEMNHSVEVKSENTYGLIVITSPYENVITTCYKVAASGKMRGGKDSLQYMLFGLIEVALIFWENPQHSWDGMQVKK